MSKRYADEYKSTITELYNFGETLAELNSDYGIPNLQYDMGKEG